jgi:hypothetical protein
VGQACGPTDDEAVRAPQYRSISEPKTAGSSYAIDGVMAVIETPGVLLGMSTRLASRRLHWYPANVKRWVPEILPLLTDDDPLGVDGFATHRIPLSEAAHSYDIFQNNQDNAVKILLQP